MAIGVQYVVGALTWALRNAFESGHFGPTPTPMHPPSSTQCPLPMMFSSPPFHALEERRKSVLLPRKVGWAKLTGYCCTLTSRHQLPFGSTYLNGHHHHLSIMRDVGLASSPFQGMHWSSTSSFTNSLQSDSGTKWLLVSSSFFIAWIQDRL